MNISKKNIYIIAAVIGVSIGAIVARYVYIRHAEEKDGVQNYTPDVEKAITTGE